MRTRILSISTACAVWAIACSAPPQSGHSAPTSSLPTGGWIDATATLDPATESLAAVLQGLQIDVANPGGQ